MIRRRYKRRFILLGIWFSLKVLLIFIWFINYFVINITLFIIIFLMCFGFIYEKIEINDKYLCIPIPFFILWILYIFYDLILFNIIFMICNLILIIKIYYILFKEYSKFSFKMRR